ncbi:hypothetical protein F5879DRAFT_927468 [Lentinula edodes]|nr:hypothetical protein F5879DRAFT_927468 [Lentinula edodes]
MLTAFKVQKKRAVTNRTEYFYNIATDFPLHRKGLLYGYNGYIDIVPVPLVPQYNDPVDMGPQYVYSDFWIPPPFNGISPNKGVFASSGRHEVECFDGQGRRAIFSIYTELQHQRSTQDRRVNRAIETCIEGGTPPRGNVLVIKHVFETGGYTDIECWDRIIINDIFQTRFIDLLGDYIEEPLAFLKMLTKTKSIVGGQFVFRFLNLLPGMARTGLPLLVFAPRLSQMIWSEFLFKIKLQCTIVSVPNVFEDYCVEYMKIEGKNHARIRILFSKRSLPLPMILAFGDTIRCSLINGRGVYVGYPDDVTAGRVVIGHTGPYAMPPLHGQRHFLRKEDDTSKASDCG